MVSVSEIRRKVGLVKKLTSDVQKMTSGEPFLANDMMIIEILEDIAYKLFELESKK